MSQAIQDLPRTWLEKPRIEHAREFIKAMLFLRLHFPSAHLTVTTRERPEIRDRLISLCATKVSAGVSTAPGGYSLDRPGTTQFDISDARSLTEIVNVIRRSGMSAAYE